MAWNEPGGNDKHQDPWGGGNKGNNQGPPDLDEVLRKFQQKLNGLFGGKGGGSASGRRGSGSGGMFSLVVIIAVVLYVWNAVYTVDEKEQAVVLRLGKYHDTVGPGLHMYFPPFEKKFQERVTEFRTYNLRQQMLTEDENIVEVAMSVQYNIGNLKDFVLQVEEPISSLEQATQSALRHVVGGSEMHSVLTEGREALADEVKERLQAYINLYKTGISVGRVNVEATQPPREVQASFDDVIRAREDKERVQNKAQAYSNAIIPEARGEAQRLIEEASGYREEVIAKAEGEADRFSKLYTEYQKAPEVTRERLYLDAVQDVLATTNKVLVDVKGGNNVMYLPLEKLTGGSSSSVNTSSSSTGLTQQEMNSIANRVADELRKRTPTSTRTGRTVR
ncbi:FtsH protease activity modulator HflK [Zooshikella marina]|uniref:FtsH protease activity modulator HflK n=1 Tax=Zooshikella ganghwensis TaxID=202772 RepID=UPI001BAF22B3|nr:FtsH protease activity modulator HflK [Zooshikella ganghwensis]MBU2706197.1 FtsH protease activity modulator HflK [Zooshikella ganghwensis]